MATQVAGCLACLADGWAAYLEVTKRHGRR